MQRLSFVLMLLFVIIISTPAFAKESPFNVDIFFGWDGFYRPLEWTPVEVGISSDLTEAFAGSIRMSAKQDGLNTMDIRHDFILTPDIPLHLPLVTKFSFNAENCKVRIIDTSRHRQVWDDTYSLWDYSRQNAQFKAVNEHDFLIGLIGEYKFGLSSLAKSTRCVIKDAKTVIDRKGRVCIGRKLPRMAPWDWTGYSALDMLILYNPDWSLFRPQQLKAVCQWVSKGGKLIIVMGSNHINTENPINSLLAFDMPDARQTTLSSADLKILNLDSSDTETIVARPVIAAENTMSLLISAKAGFGTVTVIPFDPALFSLRQKSSMSSFWINCILKTLETKGRKFAVPQAADLEEKHRRNHSRNLESRTMSSVRMIELIDEKVIEENKNYDYQFRTGLASAGSNAVMEYLYNIVEMRPLGVWPVVFLLLLLAVLVGPVDYIVLKRKGMLPLTWVTSAFWIILFSFGAYYGVQALRGGSLQMRTVSVIDGIEGSPVVWSTSYAGIFAPRSDDYEIKDQRENQWFSAVAPAERSIYHYNRQAATKHVFCIQHDGSNKPYSLPVNIWTMQCLLNESPSENIPISAAFKKEGQNVSVSIENYSSSKIRKGYIMFDGDRCLKFTGIAGASSRDFKGTIKSAVNWDKNINTLNSSNSKRFEERELETEKVFSARGCLARSQAIKSYLKDRAAVVCVEYEDAPSPFELNKKPCQYKHVQLVRLVVFPISAEKETAYDTN